jgi:hypothetical protein
MYVVAETNSGPFYLHALDITSGAEKFGGPVSVNGSVSGTGWDNNNGTIGLEHDCYQRNGLALNPANNQIYIGFGHCNHGWLLAYDKTSLKQTADCGMAAARPPSMAVGVCSSRPVWI